MSRFLRLAAILAGAFILSLAAVTAADAQGRGRRPVPRSGAAVVVSGHVFIGGYFYDPFFGPYPWWPRAAYAHWYFPVYDRRAELRITVEPDELDVAAVYVDGFYAGVVNDFDGVFQSLPLPPGGHTVVLYLEGYRTVRYNVYLPPADSFRLRVALERLPAGQASEPPPVAPPVPPPPAGSYRTPATPPPVSVPAHPTIQGSATAAAGFGTLDLRVQPASAEVVIDGQPWISSVEGHFVIQVPAGRHRVEVLKPGYQQFSTDVQVAEGDVQPLNVSLIATTR